MRPIERIDNFLNKVNWDKLWIRWNYIEFNDTLRNKTLDDIIKYWKENPDQRIGQVLINLNLIPDRMDIWLDEEDSILLDQGIAPEECLYWTSIFNKDNERLLEPITKLICELEINHINTILTSSRLNLSDLYKQAFKNVLTKKL